MKIDWKSFTKKRTPIRGKQFPIGSVVFCGHQGKGKTLSMIKYAFDVQKEFSDCLIYSNILIKGLNNYTYIGDNAMLHEALSVPSPRGCLVLLDEAHLYFNRKDGISLDVLTAISQQRKDRRRLVFSSQIWEELDISLRKQVKNVVTCRNLFGFIQFNKWSDGETLHYDKLLGEYVCDKLYTDVFKHNDQLYSSYDTRQKIVSNDKYKRDMNVATSYITIDKKR